jgi:hypothetical protein
MTNPEIKRLLNNKKNHYCIPNNYMQRTTACVDSKIWAKD